MKSRTETMAVLLAGAVGTLSAATPIGWWTMDEVDSSGRIVDKSGSNRPLKLVGNVCQTNFAVSGQALYNPGNTSGSCAQFSVPANLTERTLAMWVYLESDDGTYDYGTSKNSYPHLFNNFSGGRILWSHNDNAAKATLYVGGTPLSFAWNKPRGRWAHLAYTIGNVQTVDSVTTGDVKIYADGICTYAETQTLPDEWYSGKVHTASILGNGSDRTIHGAIDELKFYDVALTPAEIAADYAALPAPDARVFAHWTMENATTVGDTVVVTDEAGFHDLKLVSGCELVADADRESTVISFAGQNKGYAELTSAFAVRSMTFAAWLKIPNDKTPGDILSGNSYPRLFASNKSGLWAYTKASLTDYGMRTQYGSDSYGADAAQVIAEKGVWTHLAIVFDVESEEGSFYLTRRFYRNGALVATNARVQIDDSARTLALDERFFLGGQTSNRPWYGQMDDVWIFRCALTDAEVKRLYAGPSPVSAGADFTVATVTATLRGEVHPAADFTCAASPYGKTRWSLVSAPTGGEGATIAAPGQLATTVTLPVDGAYVFRLTNTEETFGTTAVDEVQVTRAAGASAAPELSVAAASPTVNLPAPAWLTATASGSPRFFWSKKSGPGGVWFDDAASATAEALFSAPGTYVLTCRAEENGASTVADVTVTVTGTSCAIPGAERGLTSYWNLDDGPVEQISQQRLKFNGVASLMKSRFGMGIGTPPQTETGRQSYVTTSVIQPISTGATVSFWMYYDHDNMNASSCYSRLWYEKMFAIQFNQGKSPSMIVGVGYSSGTDTLTFQIDPSKFRKGTRKNRWSHCAVTLDLSACEAETSAAYNTGLGLQRVKLYVDGEAFAPTKCETSATNLQGHVSISPIAANSNQTQFLGIGSNERYFPGRMDEMRYYTQILTQDEIRRLAWEFTPRLRPPQLEVPAALDLTAREEVTVDGAAYSTDAATALTCAWSVIAGDSAQIAFGSADQAETTLRVAKKGTYALQLKAKQGDLETVSEPIPCTVIPTGLLLLIK